jgi:RHS repeat-associated protein
MKRSIRGLAGLLLWLGLGVVAHAGTVYYDYTDPEGNVLAVADAQGQVVARYDYAPYGASVTSLGAPPNGPGYTGHVNDPETGLVYMQARYYQPNGRFVSPDPVGPSPGNIYSFNRYAYANNNPIVNTDPTGMFPGDGKECTSTPYPCFVAGSGGGGGRGENSGHSDAASIPARTPKSMEKYFKSSDYLSRIKAALAVMDYYHIDYSGINCCGYSTTLDYNAQLNPDGELDIGAPLFSNSFGMIGATLYHEVGVHWQMQFAKNAIVDGAYTQAWYMREIQAYDYETNDKSIHRFGLTQNEVDDEITKRNFYFRYLTTNNKNLANKGVYLPASTGL